MIEQLLKKLQETQENPGFYRALTPEEQAELFLYLFAPKPKLFKKPKVVQGIDGKTPIKDKDYQSLESAKAMQEELALKTKQELEAIIKARLDSIQVPTNGKDAVITDELIEKVAEMAQAMIVLPDFPTLITMQPEAIRDALELLPDGEKLAQEAIEGLPKRLEELENRKPQIVQSGGVSQNKVLQLIEENATSIPDGGTTGQVLKKVSDTDGDANWQDDISGVVDHSSLTGLSNDDHTQYHTDARGDARYSQLGHTHAYEPVKGTDDNYVTDSEKANLHTHANLSALGNVSGVNTGDQIIKDALGITVDGAGTVLTTGAKGFRYIEQDCTVTGWNVISDQTGSIIFDVKRAGTSITGTEKPTLATQTSNSDTTLTTWTTSLVAGDIIEFVVDSASTLTRATLTVLVTK